MRPRKTKVKNQKKGRNLLSVALEASKLTKDQRFFFNRVRLDYPPLDSQYFADKNLFPGHAKLLVAVIKDALHLVSKALQDAEYSEMDSAKKAYEWLLHGSSCTYPFSLGWICEHLNSLGYKNIDADAIAKITRGLAKENGW